MKIRPTLIPTQTMHLAFDPNLPFKPLPKKQERRLWVLRKLFAFPTFVVGKKLKSLRVEIFQQNNARRRLALHTGR